MPRHDALPMTLDGGDSEPSPTPALTRRSVLIAAGYAVAATVLAACRDDSAQAPQQTDPVEPNGIVVDVVSIDNTFRPDRIEITSGTEVRWTNRGRTEHDILPVEGTDWGVAKEDFPPGATYSHVFGGSGEVPYYCTIHGKPGFGMIGTIVIVDA